MPSSLRQLGFILACLILPILWGWLVNVLFSRFSYRGNRPTSPEREDETFSDYQI